MQGISNSGAIFIKNVRTINLKMFVRSFSRNKNVGSIKTSEDVRTSIKLRFLKTVVYSAML